MKKAIRLIVMYFIFYIVLTLLGTLFYSFYLSILSFVAGRKLNILEVGNLLQSLLYVSILMCFLIFPFLSYYRIRHVGGIFQTLAYVLLVLFTYLIFLPGLVNMKKNCAQKYPVVNTTYPLTGGYFRESNGKIYYFTKDFISNPINNTDTTTIIIDTAENGEVSVEKLKDYPEFQLYQAAKPFREVLIKETFSSEMLSKYISFDIIVQKTINSLEKGRSFYLGFISIGLAFGAIYAVTTFFKWRLLNTFLIIINSFVIVGLSNFYSSPHADGLKKLFGGGKLITALQKNTDEPILTCIYVLFSLIVIIIGIIVSIVNHKKA